MSVVKFSGGDYVLVVYVLVVKFLGGILSTYTKMSRGGFVLCPYPGIYISSGYCTNELSLSRTK